MSPTGPVASLLLLTLMINETFQGPNEKRLLADLFNNRGHNRLERPVANESNALAVVFGLTLQQIIDVDEKNQIISTNLWLNIAWNDYSLSWNETEYGDIKTIRVPPAMLWKPDILMYNSADEDIDSTFPTNVVVFSSGDCLWVPPGLFLSTCKIDITWFPFDDQHCSMKFGSWSYDSSGIDLQLQGDQGDLSSFIANGEWLLVGVPAVRHVIRYDCCPEEYIDITFTVHIRRRTLFYGFNLIIPCALISSVALLTFTLPPESGEKISLGVTILLSLTVFLLLVAEAMPPTSDAVPLIGMYFSAIMMMCSLSVVFTILVLNFHHRSPTTHTMPTWVKKIVCEWLAWLVRMQRPGAEQSLILFKRSRQLKRSKSSPSRSSVVFHELKDRSSKSLLANVLDMEDDYTRQLLRPRDGTANIDDDTHIRIHREDDTRNRIHRHDEIHRRKTHPPIATSVASNSLPPVVGNGVCNQGATLGDAPKFGSTTRSKAAATPGATATPGASATHGASTTHGASATHGASTTHAASATHGAFATHGAAAFSGVPSNECPSSTSKHDSQDEMTVSSLDSFLTSASSCHHHQPLSFHILQAILKELQTLTDKLRRSTEEEDLSNDWKFAARVIDRLCLFTFFIFTVASTFAILFSAPHVFA